MNQTKILKFCAKHRYNPFFTHAYIQKIYIIYNLYIYVLTNNWNALIAARQKLYP